MSTTLGRKTALTAVYAERYALSLVYLCLAGTECWKLWTGKSLPPGDEGAVFVEVARQVIRLLLDSFVGLLLLLGRRAAVPPKTFKDILIPLAASFYTLMYHTVPWFPASLKTSLCPPDLQTPFALAGLVLGILGPVVAVWSVIYLGRSFGVFVVVRKVVLDGPYQWVRHPMYLGYVCICTGLFLANVSGAYFILILLHISLLLYRASLEEARLSEYSAEYREYMKHTGFIFPRFRRPVG